MAREHEPRGRLLHTRRTPASLLVVGALVLSACDDNGTGPVDEVEVSALEILERSSNTQVAETHGSGSGIHWHGHIHLHPGDEVAYTARFLDENGQAIPLTGDYSVHAELAPGSPGGVVAVSPHGDHVDIEALGEGEVEVVFSLRRGSTTVWTAPPLEVEVEDHHGGGPNPSDIAAIRLDYRDGSGHIAHTHGTGAGMEWHGSLHLHPGDEVELDVTFLNAAGDTLRFFNGGEYALGASLAPGSAAGVISVDIHGDHLELTAEGEGTVGLILSILHGDHSDFDAPPFEIEVEDHDDDPGPLGIATIELLDRETGEELAHTHGAGAEMHWHGHLHLHPGDEIEVDVVFRDADGEVIDFFGGGTRTLGVRLAEGSATNVLRIESHGDHVEIEAVGEGEVELIFSILHDEESDFDTPPLEVEVVDH